MNGDPLAQLRDIQMPAAPGWWPPAPGWWLVGLLGLALVATLIWWWQRGRHSRRLRRAALLELEHIASEHAGAERPQNQLVALSQLLRRWALAHGQPAGGLAGDAWARYLAERAPLDVDQKIWMLLARGPYEPVPPSYDAEALLTGCRRWLQESLR